MNIAKLDEVLRELVSALKFAEPFLGRSSVTELPGQEAGLEATEPVVSPVHELGVGSNLGIALGQPTEDTAQHRQHATAKEHEDVAPAVQKVGPVVPGHRANVLADSVLGRRRGNTGRDDLLLPLRLSSCPSEVKQTQQEEERAGEETERPRGVWALDEAEVLVAKPQPVVGKEVAVVVSLQSQHAPHVRERAVNPATRVLGLSHEALLRSRLPLLPEDHCRGRHAKNRPAGLDPRLSLRETTP